MVNEGTNSNEQRVKDRETEAYVGQESDRRFVQEYLEMVRRIDPVEIATVPNPTRLSDIPKNSEWIDIELFKSLADSSAAAIEGKYGELIVANPK